MSLLVISTQFASALREGQCEGLYFDDAGDLIGIGSNLYSLLFLVCVGALTKLSNKLTSAEKSDPAAIETKFRELCLEAKKAENRFVSAF